MNEPPTPHGYADDLIFKHGAVLDESGLYVIVDGDRTATDGGVAHPIGQGGVGSVYRARYRKIQERAVKFLTASNVANQPGRDYEQFVRTFERERTFLAALSHGNIVHFHDAGTYKDDAGREFPYIVTSYVDGPPLQTFLRSTSCDGAKAFQLLGDVIDAVDYLHSQGVMHSDIKFENVKVRNAHGRPSAVVLDLGAAHAVGRLKEVLDADQAGPTPPAAEPPALFTPAPLDLTVTAPSDRYLFVATVRVTHEKFRARIGALVRGETIVEAFPWHDLYCVGTLLNEALDDPDVTAKLEDHLRQDGLRAMRLLVERLRRHPDDPYYENAGHLRGDWRKLQQQFLSPAGIPELSVAAEFKYSLMTPSGRGVITPRVGSLLNHKLVQRLRRVPQLELVLLKYPGASHSRLQHSAAVFRSAVQMLAHLLNDPQFRLSVSTAQLEATLVIALLHDIGHFPLSHMFEDLAAEQPSGPDDSVLGRLPWRIPTDDELFWAFFDYEDITSNYAGSNYGSVVRDAVENDCAQLGFDSPPRLSHLVAERFGSDVLEQVGLVHAAAYRGARPRTQRLDYSHLVLGAVLSSPIDCDKLAYLREDALATGVEYGNGIDVDALLGALRAPRPEDTGDRAAIGLAAKGISAAESVALARNLMVHQVYWHHTNRATMAMTHFVIACLIAVRTFEMTDWLRAVLFLEYEGALEHLARKFDAAAPVIGERIFDGLSPVNPLNGLLHGERRIYKHVFESDPDEYPEASTRLTNLTTDGRLAVGERVRLALNSRLGTALVPGEVVLDVPRKERGEAGGSRSGRVLVYRGRDAVGAPLNEMTPFLRAIGQEHEAANRVARVYVAPGAYPLLGRQRQDVSRLIEEVTIGAI